MSELRWDPLQREWVTVAPWRQERTYHPMKADCPLCPTRAGMAETEIPEPDYYIAVFENRFPSYTGAGGGAAGEGLRPAAAPGGLSPHAPGGGAAGEGLRPAAAPGGLSPHAPGGGRCEVVCYTSEHDSSLGAQSVEHIRDLVEVWQDRYTELKALPNVSYVFIFENRGEEIGVTLSHPHGQIYAYPFVPPRVAREVESSRLHHQETGRCLYCDVLAGESGGERTVASNDAWLAFVPKFARWPYEVHLAPRGHAGDITELSEAQADGLAQLLKSVLQKYDALFSKPLAYVMAMHQRPPESSDRDYHFHIEFYPPNRSADKLKMLAGSELGAGAFILDARAEDTAKQLREIGS